ncbi:MAG: hypothetical protein IJL43_03525 [Lachnospiraceae bacterium]|nr:hypothetical protein [Lachnospiraceae bacterium]
MSSENNVNTAAQGGEEKTDSKLWENIDAATVNKEFLKLGDSLTGLAAELEKLAKDASNFDKAKETLEKVRDKDLSSSGWLSSFISENTSAFPGLNGNGSKKASRPDWYYMLMPDKKKKYDDILDFMDDAIKIQSFFRPFVKVLSGIPLKDTFRIFAIIRNMKSRGWTEGEYQLINKDIESVNELLKQGFGTLNSKAVLSERYYQAHISQMDSPKIKEGYLKQRQEDYLNIIKQYEIYKSLRYKGNGRYYIYGDRAASAKTLDAYMGKIVMGKDLGDRLNTVLANADNLQKSLMANIVLHTSAGQALHRDLLKSLVTIQYHLICSNEEFTKFRKGDSEAPYCYMKCPKAAEQAAGYFGFAPAWGDSWDKGTGYYEIYRKILFAIMEQSRDFTYVHGRVH